MIADRRFRKQPKHFWANVRTISQHLGYTARGTGQIFVPTISDMIDSMQALDLSTSHLVDASGRRTELADVLLKYFAHRARVLNSFVEPRLMDAVKAKKLFEKLIAEIPSCRAIPLNKQKGEKRNPAYFTACINLLLEANISGTPCDYDPRELTTITHNRAPLRTLARRVDGAYPGPVNPIAVWEVKEYYYTTTFGSRVADGVYESLLDGLELEELREQEQIDVKHYLMIDAYFTWWNCGKSYLCRIIDMLHMGLVDEVLFGTEIVDRLPVLARQWVKAYQRRPRRSASS